MDRPGVTGDVPQPVAGVGSAAEELAQRRALAREDRRAAAEGLAKAYVRAGFPLGGLARGGVLSVGAARRAIGIPDYEVERQRFAIALRENADLRLKVARLEGKLEVTEEKLQMAREALADDCPVERRVRAAYREMAPGRASDDFPGCRE